MFQLAKILRQKSKVGLGDPGRRLSSVEAMNHALCMNQLQGWLGRRLLFRDALEEYRSYNANRPSTFLFIIKNGEITLARKPGDTYGHAAIPSILQDRANSYLSFFKQILESNHRIKDCAFAVEVGDGPLNSTSAPVFSFQKSIGDSSLLLNDVNLIEGNFYEDHSFSDTVSYSTKIDMAVFAGATTGDYNTLESVRSLRNPRIRAGLFFKNSDVVDFRLPNIVQCDAESEKALRGLGFGSERAMSWDDQFRYKFLISMDGNGATCQRLAVALKSNSVVLKYDSSSQLYYFSCMIPWYHYIPISKDADVIEVVSKHAQNADLHYEISQNGRDFAEKLLNRTTVMHYADLLLSKYTDIFDYENR